ncbi:hypothetical protein [Crystallibacter degradans]|uniref:hypothetical protein n=1 Tax=Crystallibacter degradans TaxID=2726743 RepID=UPI00197B714F|nr:hypothetical protein [Arthrobacter sp. SF27]
MDGFDSGYMLDDERNRLGQDQARLADQELIRDLRDLLGAKLVAYIASVKETRTVGQWAEGKRTPSAQVMQRLRTAHDVAAVIGTKDSRAVVQPGSKA